MPARQELANAIRALSVDAIEKAKSGHPGAPLGMADMAESLWRHFFKHNPADPAWPDRDRFILSNGHASMLLYALLHLTGYDVSLGEIKNFRQWGSKTPGHPERGITPGVEMTTGPLGQGLASGVGAALAEAMLAAEFNKPGFAIVDHYTYVFAGDGCMMEGVSHEACSLAGTWKLGKLIVFYDANGVSIDGKVDPWFNENTAQRFASYNWQVIGPLNGHDPAALDKAASEARAEKHRPSLIICETHIGFGSPKRDTSASHGAPLGAADAAITKKNLNWQNPEFVIPEEIYKDWDAREKGEAAQKAWLELFDGYAREYPALAAEFRRRMAGDLPRDWNAIAEKIIAAAQKAGGSKATRAASHDCLEILVPALPELVGGSADLSGSVGAQTKASIPLDPDTYKGNYLYYGVREFGMGAIMNGIAIHGGFIPYAGTFLAFSDQARNALRLSSIMGLRVIWILTHDSIGVGEDGPTHQPVEQIPTLRLQPALNVWRPCDSAETAQAWISAITTADKPTCLVLSRQKLPEFPASAARMADIAKGGYILKDCEGQPELIFIATGSEVAPVMAAADLLAARGRRCRVVSMPCAEIFDAQSREWREGVLPPNVGKRLAVEASVPDWWIKYAGLDGAVLGVAEFGKSAPGDALFDKYGLTAANIAAKAEKLLEA